jgi:predicted RNase H-like HicB family nuclease
MRHAHYELLEDDGSFHGEIAGFPGVWARGPTLEACREELLEVLEGCVVLGLQRGDELLRVDGLTLHVVEVA